MTNTRLYRALLMTLLCSLMSFVAAAAPHAGARAVDEAWREAIIANDLERIMAVYAENAVMWLPNAPEAKGLEAIRKSYAALLAANKVTMATLSNTHYETSGNLSVGWGDFSLTLSPKSGGEPVTLSGRFSVIAKKRAGTWVYVVDHASATPPDPR